MTRIKKLFLFLFVTAMTVALSLGIAACGEEEKPVTYTVTVTCEEESALSGVKARLEKEGKQSEEKALSGGKATFELEAGTYTVVLTGVPEGYTYETKTVTKNAPNATVTLTKKNDQPADGLVSYTVTVTCEDETALSGVKVRLMLGTTVADEQPLTDGKASFKLAPANYTATLTGVPAGYTYEPKTLGGPNSNVTIALTKVSASADVTVKVAAGTDIFGKSQGETLLKNAQVKIYRAATDTEPVASAVTNENGVAHFETLTAGRYLVNVNGKEFQNIPVESGAATVTLNEKLGSKYAPFAWKVGENEVPFTREVLESLGDDSVYYTLVVSENGVYSFDTDENAIVTSDILDDGLSYTDRHLAVTLTAGTVYTFACSSGGQNSVGGNFGYTVTVTKGDTQEGGTTPDPDDPSTPWSGNGTEAQPYIIETLVGEYNDIYVKYNGTAFNTVYFKYIPADDGSYTVTLTKPENAIVTFVGARPVVGYVNPVLSGAEGGALSANIKLTKGTTFMIHITGNDEAENPASFSCSFKVETYTAPAAKKGSVYDPDTLTALLGTHVVTTANTYYYRYHSAEAGVYAVSTAYSQGIVFSVRTELNPDGNGAPTGKKLYDLKLSISDLGKFELEADKDYYFGISSNAQGEASGAEETLNFTVENFVAGEPDGTQANPYPLENLFGEHTFEKVGSDGVYYTATLEEATELKISSVGSQYYRLKVIQKEKDLLNKQVTSATASYTVNVEKGEFQIYVENLMDGTMTVKLKIEQVGGSETPITGSGTAADPEKVTALEGSYSREASYADGWYLAFTAKEAAIYTFTNNSTAAVYVRFGDASATGKGSAINKGAEKAFLTEANTDYVIAFFPQGNTKTSFSMSITKSALPSYSWQGEGTEASPYVLTDTSSLELWVDSVKDLYFKYTAKGNESVTFTPSTKLTVTLIGKQWADGTEFYKYSANPSSEASRTISLSAGETLVFAVGTYSGTALTQVKLNVTASAANSTTPAAVYALSPADGKKSV